MQSVPHIWEAISTGDKNRLVVILWEMPFKAWSPTAQPNFGVDCVPESLLAAWLSPTDTAGRHVDQPVHKGLDQGALGSEAIPRAPIPKTAGRGGLLTRLESLKFKKKTKHTVCV